MASGALTRMDVAFSRDQPEKVYVQHRLWERRAELGPGCRTVRSSTSAATPPAWPRTSMPRSAHRRRRRPGRPLRRGLTAAGLARGADPRSAGYGPQGRLLMAERQPQRALEERGHQGGSPTCAAPSRRGWRAPLTGAIAEDDTQLTKFHGTLPAGRPRPAPASGARRSWSRPSLHGAGAPAGRRLHAAAVAADGPDRRRLRQRHACA